LIYEDTLNQFCKECGLETAWSICSDLKDGVHLQTSAGRSYIPEYLSMKRTADQSPQDSVRDLLAAEDSFYKHGDQRLIRGVARDLIVAGVIEKDTDMRLSQDMHLTMYCEMDEIAVALQLPVSKVVGVSGAVGFIERSRVSKPVYEMTARVAPFVEDLVRYQIHLRRVRNVSSESMAAPEQAHPASLRQKGDAFKVLARPMTPSTQSVHVEVCFKDKADMAAFEQSLRARRLDVEITERAGEGYVGAVRILNCDGSRFKDFLEGHIRMSLRDAWSHVTER